MMQHKNGPENSLSMNDVFGNIYWGVIALGVHSSISSFFLFLFSGRKSDFTSIYFSIVKASNEPVWHKQTQNHLILLIHKEYLSWLI